MENRKNHAIGKKILQKPLHFSKKCGMIDKHEKIRLSVPEVTGEVNAKKTTFNRTVR